MVKSYFIAALTALAILAAGCKSKAPVVTTTSFRTYKTECLGARARGIQTLMVYVKADSKGEAVELAREKAVEEVLFEGINAGNSECSAYAIIDSPVLRRNNEDYFTRFFQKKQYNKYTKVDKEAKKRVDRYQGSESSLYAVEVDVDVAKLRKKMNDDNIIR